MAKSTWRMVRHGQWVKEDGGSPPPSGRPTVPGASATKAPGSPVTPCPLGTLKATVVRADNQKPIRGFVVLASGPDVVEMSTDGAGLATFSKIAPGPYRLSVAIPSAKALELQEPPACPDVEVATSSTHAVTIEVEPLAVVKVKVKDKEQGQSIAGARVVLLGADGGSHQDSAMRDGIATIRGVPRGSYSAALTLEEPADKQFVIPADSPKLEVKSGDEHSLDIELVKRIVSWIGIELVGEDGSPVPNQSFRIKLPDGMVKEGRLDSRGQARYESVEPGDCEVTFPDLDEEAWGRT